MSNQRRDFSNMDGEVLDYDIVPANQVMRNNHYDDTFNPDGHLDGVNSFVGDYEDDYYDDYEEYDDFNGGDMDSVFEGDDLMFSEARGRRRKKRPRKGKGRRATRQSQRDRKRSGREDRKEQRQSRRQQAQDRRSDRSQGRQENVANRIAGRREKQAGQKENVANRIAGRREKQAGKSAAQESQSRAMTQLAAPSGGDDELTRAMLATAPPVSTTGAASGGMSKGLKIGLIVGGLAILGVAALLIVKTMKKGKK